MALFVSCILTMHMMLYFFHHFELPFVLNTFQIRMTMANTRPNTNTDQRQQTNQTQRQQTNNSQDQDTDSNIVLESNGES